VSIPAPDKSQTFRLITLIGVQTLCAAFFLNDALDDMMAHGRVAFSDWHLIIETLAALALIFGVVFETRYLMRLLRRQAHMARGLQVAAGALHELIETYYDTWRLTPAEQDVASFTLKGFSTGEIAGFRGSAEGTIKAHLNAIYRKSGASGRSALISLLLEDLMQSALIERVEPPRKTG